MREENVEYDIACAISDTIEAADNCSYELNASGVSVGGDYLLVSASLDGRDYGTYRVRVTRVYLDRESLKYREADNTGVASKGGYARVIQQEGSGDADEPRAHPRYDFEILREQADARHRECVELREELAHTNAELAHTNAELSQALKDNSSLSAELSGAQARIELLSAHADEA